MRWTLVLLLIACKGGAKQPEGAGSAGSGSAAAPVAPIDAAPADAAAAAVPADAPQTDIHAQETRCGTACLYLVDTPLEQARVAFEHDCGKSWPYTDCDQLLWARNCIYAAYGNVFKKPDWKQAFEHAPWYRPRPEFKERDFSPAAAANVHALVEASKACVIPPVTDADKALAKEWFDKLRLNQVTVPGLDLDWFVERWQNYGVEDHVKFVYRSVPTADRREIEMTGLYHAVGGGKTDPDTRCVLVFDGKDQLVEVPYD